MNNKVVLLFFLLMIIKSNAQEVKVTSGKVERFANFKSHYVDARNIDVWLPEGYSDKKKYPVLYMHDGQMLFDAETTWNKQAWELDEVAGKLIAENKIRKFIIVGISNNGLKRHLEYFPQKAFEKLSSEQKDFVSNELLLKKKIDQKFIPISDNYLKFIVTELKPFIDKTFSTKKDVSNTFIAGSSMGGLISMYAICEYPKVFGGAACLSTHLSGIYQIDNNPVPQVLYDYLKSNLPNPKNHKIYFDYGNQTLDALYPTLQKQVDIIMREKGFTVKNWVTKFFPGKDHSENAWHERFHFPLEFLMKK
ncbi:alpha/beta hydrolase-fold protein [Flavobacterium paronense]|uniref:Alpha/beta hydrolase n=1 Tax=Flavobacterium paronense TaxID=1392775 RepID=A0ABV5GAZ6_9FLAO|nr:alpha/beta hydrolase-fold protein [Flavobacterium paronense]MDN3676802.1 alpha/beta hydrolase-fold protein [Flavobacterium paronense]